MTSPHVTSMVDDGTADTLADLNEAQREAVLHFEGPLLVLAGAGSGKTRVLTRRIARLIDHHGVDPSRILAVTFTNKAAQEMRGRVARLLGEEPTGMWIGTFHAIGARMLRREAQLIGRTNAFTIYDEEQSLAVVKRVMDRLRISSKTWSPKAIRAAISDAKNALVSVEEYASLALDPLSRAAAQVYEHLEVALRDANAVDFDDLLVHPVRIFQNHANRLASYRERFQFILVDEYQDTNRAQYQLIALLGAEHGNVCVVGDDDQSIYGWRGADIRNILDFEKDFPAARVVRLEENYRSTPEVLELANVVISVNASRRGKTLRATRGGGEQVTVVGCLDERDEAEWVADEIKARQALGRPRFLRDIAVLYRTNAQSRALEESLRRRGMPYKLIGAVRFYDRREIRDLMSYLRLIANPADDDAFLRAIAVPKRGLGDTTLDALGEIARGARISMLEAAGRGDLLAKLRPAARQALADFAALLARFRERAEDTAVDELLRMLIEEIRYVDVLRAEGPDSTERIDNVRELVVGAAEQVADEGGEVGTRPLDHFLQRASLITDVDRQDPDAEAVTMMTLHNAKGLEFPVVFITGLEEGLFPLSRAHDEPEQLEEERRLFYVGITRAEEKLYLTHARSRRRNGENLPSIPSSFLQPIPHSMLDQQSTIRLRATGKSVLPMSPSMRRPGTPVRSMRAVDHDVEASQDAPRFVKGERVKHGRFGAGSVVELTGVGREMKVTVDFDDESVGRKRLVVAYAGLEREWV
ncbi:MAG TPA: UvrD-helicase domain-containing protein [Gemmatimonadaceae bacterium]|nr:UvrD-helicase domain-containing protein [Gemmatimonadaceae bacterium]